MTLAEIEPGMLIRGGEPGWQTTREIVSIDRDAGRLNFRLRRLDHGMQATRIYKTTITAFLAWAKDEA